MRRETCRKAHQLSRPEVLRPRLRLLPHRLLHQQCDFLFRPFFCGSFEIVFSSGANRADPRGLIMSRTKQFLDSAFSRHFCFPHAAPPPRQIRVLMRIPNSWIRVCSPRPFPIIPPKPSRSFQPSPVEGVPPRSPNLDCGRFVQRAERQTPPRQVELSTNQKLQ